MAKEKPVENKVVVAAPVSAPEQLPTNVEFTSDQMAIIQQMIESAKGNTNTDSAVSVYEKRDPTKIEKVKVSVFEGKYVLGFKDLQNNKFKKTAKYSINKADPIRKLPSEPYVVLLLSEDGKEIEEMEVRLVDYMENREKIELPVVSISRKEIINDHGILGSMGDDMAYEIDNKGNAIRGSKIKAESKTYQLKIYVEIPGFDKPVEFIEDFLA